MSPGSKEDCFRDTEEVLTSRETCMPQQQEPSPNPDLFYRLPVSNYFTSCFLKASVSYSC